jgi:hypothetical protein
MCRNEFLALVGSDRMLGSTIVSHAIILVRFLWLCAFWLGLGFPGSNRYLP